MQKVLKFLNQLIIQAYAFITFKVDPNDSSFNESFNEDESFDDPTYRVKFNKYSDYKKRF